jgi:hypothetical protein
MRKTWSRALTGLVVTMSCAALAPVASALIRPAIALKQTSTNTHAGSTVNLPVDLTFAPGADSPKDFDPQPASWAVGQRVD